MAKKLYEESNIQAIANAIREKNGETTTYKPSEMAAAITAITTGEGGGGVEVEPIVLTGNQVRGCSGPFAGKYIELFGNTITTENINNTNFMFEKYILDNIPFDINMKVSTGYMDYYNMSYMFAECNNLKELPKIYNAKPGDINSFLYSCYNLREIPEDFINTWDFSSANDNNSLKMASMFSQCYSLRTIPSNFLNKLWNKNTGYYNKPYSNMFNNCYCLDEIVGISSGDSTSSYTAMIYDMFSATIVACYRIKNFIFEVNDDGTAKSINWKAQTIDLSEVGYCYPTKKSNITSYNSGITADKEVTNDATYQALKNDPDWFTCDVNYSRYNRISAVETINSLPDTSAYLATAGGTNTIKFKGVAGLGTDGGAINTLTEEEIAVATAKGWTVSFV